MQTGNLQITRDFLDVRDVVKAYYTLFKKGKKGEVYNICSGVGITLADIILRMADILSIQVTTIKDQNLVRPNDNILIKGSNEKIKSETGWSAAISLDQSLRDILQYWENIQKH